MNNNNKAKKYKGTVSFTIASSIVLFHAILFSIIWTKFYFPGIVDPFYQKGTLLLVVVYSILFSTFSTLYGGFGVGHFRVSDVIYSQIITLTFVNIITYLQISLISREMTGIIGILIMYLIQIFASIVWAYYSNKLYLKVNPPQKILMIYGNENVDVMINKMSSRGDKYDIQKVININEGIENILPQISKYDSVVVYDIESQTRNKIVKHCYENSIRVYITPKISDIIIGTSDVLHLFDTPLLVCKNRGLTFEQSLMKRIVDIAISLPLIIITLPLMIIVAIAIKLEDGGDILFKQTRLTLNDKEFTILKFRSMVPTAEKDGVARLATKTDDRITKVGKIIRTLRFDELPQLFNILKGDMSIVGPRPERPELAIKHLEDMPEFRFRTKVKAGLTGYAQVKGKYNTTPYDKLKLDLMYIEKYSLIMDFKLILMTIKIIFAPESTEGVDENLYLTSKKDFKKAKTHNKTTNSTNTNKNTSNRKKYKH